MHCLDPIVIIKISVLPPDALSDHISAPNLDDRNFIYEAVLSKAASSNETRTVLGFAIEWFQSQAEYKTTFQEWFYTLVDDNGANSFSSFYKLDPGGKLVCYDYLYKVNHIRETMILCDRLRVANADEKEIYPNFGNP